MIGMGIDASTTAIGWSIFDEDKLIDCGKLLPTKRDLDWTQRIKNFIPQMQKLIDKYNPQVIVEEEVPKMKKGGNLVLIQLGAVRGMILTISTLNNIPILYKEVGTWRHDIGINDGDKRRDSKKIRSLEKANECFGLNLKIIFTKNGKYNEDKSDDDISDAIWVYASTLDKYKIKPKSFGKKKKVDG